MIFCRVIILPVQCNKFITAISFFELSITKNSFPTEYDLSRFFLRALILRARVLFVSRLLFTFLTGLVIFLLMIHLSAPCYTFIQCVHCHTNHLSVIDYISLILNGLKLYILRCRARILLPIRSKTRV